MLLYLHEYSSQVRTSAGYKNLSGLLLSLSRMAISTKMSWGPNPDAQGLLGDPTPEGGERLRNEFLGEGPEELIERISQTSGNRRAPDAVVGPTGNCGLMPGIEENLEWFPRYQASLQEHRPPTRSFWGSISGDRRLVNELFGMSISRRGAD
jgi:hypothetical protein